MTPTSKLRVATADVAEALDILKVEVEGATGFAVEPELQEIDCDDLVVEMRLTDSNSADPGLVARAIERSVCDVDVLSVWKEAPLTRVSAPVTGHTVFNGTDDALPDVARRALHDNLATAQWLGTVEGAGRGDQSYWELAVPVVRSDGQAMIGVRRRHGYSLRFSVQDAATLRMGLAS